MKSLRFNTPIEWRYNNGINQNFFGFLELCFWLGNNLKPKAEMIEIGSYMGESTMLFASTGIFSTINSIDPHSGKEEFNDICNYEWDFIEKEFDKNIRFFENITHYKNHSFEIVDKFMDNSIDFIYIDGNHAYEPVKRDIQLFLPKIKSKGIIGGHDYNEYSWPDVCKAVDECIGFPDRIFSDSSWVKLIN